MFKNKRKSALALMAICFLGTSSLTVLASEGCLLEEEDWTTMIDIDDEEFMRAVTVSSIREALNEAEKKSNLETCVFAHQQGVRGASPVEKLSGDDLLAINQLLSGDRTAEGSRYLEPCASIFFAKLKKGIIPDGLVS